MIASSRITALALGPMVGLALFLAASGSVSASPPKSVTDRFELCGPVRVTCVVDGDTFWLDGVKVRIADIDTPEIAEPGCESEYALGMRATQRLRELLNDGPFLLLSLQGRDEDRQGRKLRIVTRHGRSLGNQMVSEGLARIWSGRREPWC